MSLRSPWLAAGWFLALVGLSVGLATASSGDVVGVVLGGVITAAVGWALLRIPFMHVRATSAGLTNHGLLRNRHIRGEEVSEVLLEQTDDRLLGQVFTPVLRLGEDEWPLVQLSGYSTWKRVGRSRVGRQTEALRRLLA